MKTIKLTTPWPHDYYLQSSGKKGVFDGFRFEINNSCNECDYWIVWGGLPKKEKVKVHSGLAIYITDEAHDQRKFNYDFMCQFPFVASVRKDIDHSSVIPIHEIAPWYFRKSYDFLAQLEPPVKTKSIAIISSNLSWLPGHKKRLDFVNAIIKEFGGAIDLYGRGFNEIADKYDALIDYKYSMAIENNSLPGYFTEKISECFLTYTVPVYYGCPDIETYYDKKSFVSIDINDYKSSFEIISELISSDPYSEILPFLQDSRKRYLTKYHLFPSIIKLVERVEQLNHNPKKRTNIQLIPERNYIDEVSDRGKGKVSSTIRSIGRFFNFD